VILTRHRVVSNIILPAAWLLGLAAVFWSAGAFAQEGRNIPSAVGIGVGISGSQSGASAGAQSGNSLTFNSPSSVQTRVSGTTRVIAAPSVFAPGLAAAGIETCLGSVSGGVAFPGGGVSFGSTTKDAGCESRLDARTLWAFGLKSEAVARLCARDEIRAAMPNRCPQPVQTASSQQGVSYVPATVAAVGVEGEAIMVTEGRTGRDRMCASYSYERSRCLKWAR
jgi:hypothetical protein